MNIHQTVGRHKTSEIFSSHACKTHCTPVYCPPRLRVSVLLFTNGPNRSVRWRLLLPNSFWCASGKSLAGFASATRIAHVIAAKGGFLLRVAQRAGERLDRMVAILLSCAAGGFAFGSRADRQRRLGAACRLGASDPKPERPPCTAPMASPREPRDGLTRALMSDTNRLLCGFSSRLGTESRQALPLAAVACLSSRLVSTGTRCITSGCFAQT